MDVYTQQKRDQHVGNQAPQGWAHVKAKILLPWPTELRFKTAHFRTCVWSPPQISSQGNLTRSTQEKRVHIHINAT